jgi:hypothetical protein
MAELLSNQQVDNLQLYAGIAGTAGVVGLAYGVDHASPLYKKDAKAAKEATKQAKNKKAAEEVTNKKIRLAEPTQDQKNKWREHNEKIKAKQDNWVDPRPEWRKHNENLRAQQEGWVGSRDELRAHNEALRDARKGEEVLKAKVVPNTSPMTPTQKKMMGKQQIAKLVSRVL